MNDTFLLCFGLFSICFSVSIGWEIIRHAIARKKAGKKPGEPWD